MVKHRAGLPPKILGIGMMAYYGGRAECRIRRVVVPVVYCDFLSMYPTVNALLGVWPLLSAHSVRPVEATDDIQRLLAGLTVEDVFDPKTWRCLVGFALVEPAGDILPVRAQYDAASDAWNIGINPLRSATPLWYAIPDLVASTLLTGRPPKVLQAFRLAPRGRRKSLMPAVLRGEVPVDPARDDFFRFVIEARRRAKRGDTAAGTRSADFLKVLANSGSYGVFAELNRDTLPVTKPAELVVYGLAGTFGCWTHAPEDPGAYCCPPFAALTTAGARLMLALLERLVTDAGGTYAFCDTDSMAIVATKDGGLVACPGGRAALPDGAPAVRALSGEAVHAIVERFAALNPYDRALVPGSILKVEDENFVDGQPAPLFCYAISAKRYALCTRMSNEEAVLRKWSEHGLGHLLNPSDPDDESRDWIQVLWATLLADTLVRPVARPAWLDRPAVSRLTISHPTLLRPFAKAQRHVPYADQVKPMSFILSAHVAPLGHPPDADPTRFHLIAPYTANARQWTKTRWVDIYSGGRYGITTAADPSRGTVRVQSYQDVLGQYRSHPEAKSAGPDGAPCGRDTIGLLARRSVTALSIEYIGKEANRLEEVEGGLIHTWEEVVATYADPTADDWTTKIVPLLKKTPRAELARLTGLSDSTIRRLRNGRTCPRAQTVQLLLRALVAHNHGAG